MIRLIVVDDQPLVRKGLASLLSLEEDLEVIGQAPDGKTAISMAEQLRPDVVIMDVRMPGGDGVTAAEQILACHPEIKIVMLTTFDDDEYIVRAVQAGISGYLLKDSEVDEIAQVVRAVHRGYTQLGPTIAQKLSSHVRPVDRSQPDSHKEDLSAREREVLMMIARGMSNREIARALSVTEGTVKNHVTSILGRLNVRDRTQAALWAQENLV